MASAFTITEHMCGRGKCDLRMPCTLVVRGWKYLRGHKPLAGPSCRTVATDVGCCRSRACAESRTEARTAVERERTVRMREELEQTESRCGRR